MSGRFDFLKIIKLIEENRLSFFSSQDISDLLHVETGSIQNYLETLANNELIRRIEKGKYCRSYLNDPFIIGSHLIEEGVIAYRSALSVHGLTTGDQDEIFVASCHQKTSKAVMGTNYRFIRIRPHKYFGIQEMQNNQGNFRVTNPEKTLLDSFDLPGYALPVGMLAAALGRLEINESLLIRYGIRMQNLSVLKRLAYLSERLELGNYAAFRKSTLRMINDKYTLLDPAGENKGRYDHRWKIRDNLLSVNN